MAIFKLHYGYVSGTIYDMKSVNLDKAEVLKKFEELGSVRKTAKAFNVHHRTMSKYLGVFGLVLEEKTQVLWIDNNRIKCSVCSETKPLEQIAKNKSSTRAAYYHSFCIECRKERVRARRLGKDQSFKEKVSRINQSAKRADVDFAISPEYLEFLWEWQEGRCFYTDQPMSRKMGRKVAYRDSWSVDRIEPEKGYVAGNIVLCTHKVNTIKSDMTLEEMKLWTPIWYKRLQSYPWGARVSAKAHKMTEWFRLHECDYGDF